MGIAPPHGSHAALPIACDALNARTVAVRKYHCIFCTVVARKLLEYAGVSVSFGDGSLTAFVCEDFKKVTNDICYEGRSPKGEDEIAVGNALAQEYPIGSRIEITSSDKSENYRVTGYIQSVNNGGNVCGHCLRSFVGDCGNLVSSGHQPEDFCPDWGSQKPLSGVTLDSACICPYIYCHGVFHQRASGSAH